jgi:hypothetical protein
MKVVFICVGAWLLQCIVSIVAVAAAVVATMSWSGSRVGPVMLAVIACQFLIFAITSGSLWWVLRNAPGDELGKLVAWLFTSAFGFVTFAVLGLSNFVLFNR